MMCPVIDNLTSCEICRYLLSSRKSMSTMEIHHEFCTAIYSQNVMSEGTVRQRCTVFKHGQTNVHEEE
jgi:hypothetical protein